MFILHDVLLGIYNSCNSELHHVLNNKMKMLLMNSHRFDVFVVINTNINGKQADELVTANFLLYVFEYCSPQFTNKKTRTQVEGSLPQIRPNVTEGL